MKRIDYYCEFLERLSDFLGVKLRLKETQYQVEFIPEFNSKFIKKSLEQTGAIFLILGSLLDEYYEDNKNVYFTDLIEEFSQRIIGQMTRGQLSVTKEQINFMDNVKNVCNETYESENSSLNILLFKDNKKMEIELNKMDLDFIAFSSPKEVTEIFKEKLSLKMLNGDNLVLVLGKDFKGYGLGVNRKKKTLFKDRMLLGLKEQNNEYLISLISFLSHNILKELEEPVIMQQLNRGFKINERKLKELTKYSNTRMVSSTGLFRDSNWSDDEKKKPYIYMQINSYEIKIYLQNSIDNYLSYSRGNWKLKSFHVLKFLILEKFYMDSFLYHLFIERDNKKDGKSVITQYILNIDTLTSLIKNLIEEGKGGLFIILDRKVEEKEREKIFINGSESKSIYKKTVLKNEKISSLIKHNYEYLKLISKVDGAVVLNNELGLISFGRLVKLNVNNTNERIEGARSAAAISGSKYGLAIKVSEDKHISVWEDGIKVLEI